jgi:hypothetical protein
VGRTPTILGSKRRRSRCGGHPRSHRTHGPVHRRWRIHGIVDSGSGEGTRPQPGRGPSGGRHLRKRRLRPQRRFRRGQPHPRRRQRAAAFPQRARHARTAWPRQPQCHRGDHQATRHRLCLRAHRCDRRGHLSALPRRNPRRLPRAAIARPAGRTTRPGCHASPGAFAHLHRRPVAQRPGGDARPGASGLGPQTGGPGTGCSDL